MPIVTNGLIGYWNARQGIEGTVWKNIAPATKGQYDGTILGGAIINNDGVIFDSLDDNLTINIPSLVNLKTDITLDFGFTIPKISKNFVLKNPSTHIQLYADNMVNFKQYNIVNSPSEMILIKNDMLIEGILNKLTLTYNATIGEASIFVNGIFNEKIIFQDYGNVRFTNEGIFKVFDKINGIGHYFRIYNRVLSNSEVLQNAEKGTAIGIYERIPNSVSNFRMQENTNTSITLTWSPDVNADSYILKRNGIVITEIMEPYFKDQNLIKNTIYNYEIVAKNELGSSPSTHLAANTTNLTLNTISILEDFEDDTMNFTFTGTWARVSGVIASSAHSGTGVLSSGVTEHSQSKEVSFPLNIPLNATNVSFEFKYKVSSESGYDKFFAYIDNSAVVNGLSGNVEWTTYKSLTLTPGSKVVKLEYTKDGSVSSGLDAVYIDDIKLTYDVPTQTQLLPNPTIVSTSRSKISDEAGVDRSNVTFKFDKDVQAWKVQVLGTSPTTGTNAASGGAVTANTEITAEIDWTELYQEGQNKINIYGQGTDGNWTPYEG